MCAPRSASGTLENKEETPTKGVPFRTDVRYAGDVTTPPALAAAATALQGATGLPTAGWDDLDGTEALAAAATLATLKALVDGALVAVAERLESTGAADAVGWASTKDFLTHVLGGRKGAGAGLVRVAQQTARLPRVRAALAAGQISLAQAGVIAGRVTTLPQAPELRDRAAQAMLDIADQHGYDATDLDRAFPALVRELDPDGTLLGSDLDQDLEERGAHHARFLSLTPDTLGGVRITGYASHEQAELVKATLMPLAAPRTTAPRACGATDQGRHRDGRRYGHGCPDPDCFHDGRDPREAGARLWDALVEACHRLHATDALPHTHATTARLWVTITLEDLQDRLDRHGLLPTGQTISAAAARRLACDAELIPAVLGTDSQVLDLARTSRLVTPGIWNALVLRDRHCAFPGCTPPPSGLPGPPHPPLGRRRPHPPGQPHPALPQTPHHHPPHTLARPHRPRHPTTGLDTPTHPRRPRPDHLPPRHSTTLGRLGHVS